MTVPGFEVAEPMKGRAQRPGYVDSVVVVELEPGKTLANDLHYAFDSLFQLFVTSARKAVGGGVKAGMFGNY